MHFRVKRDSHKIKIIEELHKEDLYGLSRGEFLTINDTFIIKEITEAMAKGYIVSLNAVTKKIETEVDKFHNIPTTDVKRVQAIKSASERVESLTNEVELIDYISYIDANNVLNSHGFHITDDNREEQYLNILEDGNESLIDVLEEFLTLKDKLNKVKSVKREYDKVIEIVKTTSEEDLDLDKLFG